jgi:hypothetical protein
MQGRRMFWLRHLATKMINDGGPCSAEGREMWFCAKSGTKWEGHLTNPPANQPESPLAIDPRWGSNHRAIYPRLPSPDGCRIHLHSPSVLVPHSLTRPQQAEDAANIRQLVCIAASPSVNPKHPYHSTRHRGHNRDQQTRPDPKVFLGVLGVIGAPLFSVHVQHLSHSNPLYL